MWQHIDPCMIWRRGMGPYSAMFTSRSVGTLLFKCRLLQKAGVSSITRLPAVGTHPYTQAGPPSRPRHVVGLEQVLKNPALLLLPPLLQSQQGQHTETARSGCQASFRLQRAAMQRRQPSGGGPPRHCAITSLRPSCRAQSRTYREQQLRTKISGNLPSRGDDSRLS